MRLPISAVVFLAASLVCQGQALNFQNVKEQYPTYFNVYVGTDQGQHWFAPSPRTDVPADDPLALLFNQNRLYVDYLLQNYRSSDAVAIEKVLPDSAKAAALFAVQLRNDRRFEKLFKEQVAHFLAATGRSLAAYQPQPKMSLSADSLMTIAAQFFYAMRERPDSSISWKVCVGMNGFMQDKHDDMQPLVEAFCFQAVFNQYDPEKPGYATDFLANARQITRETRALHGEERLGMARRRMTALMKTNDALRTVLLGEYEKKKPMLNFTLR